MPICTTHPTSEMEYVASDSGASVLVADAKFAEKGHALAKSMGIPFVQAVLEASPSLWDSDVLPTMSLSDGASILYTSGTLARVTRCLCACISH